MPSGQLPDEGRECIERELRKFAPHAARKAIDDGVSVLDEFGPLASVSAAALQRARRCVSMWMNSSSQGDDWHPDRLDLELLGSEAANAHRLDEAGRLLYATVKCVLGPRDRRGLRRSAAPAVAFAFHATMRPSAGPLRAQDSF